MLISPKKIVQFGKLVTMGKAFRNRPEVITVGLMLIFKNI
jgi:hypothetical protein